MIVSVLMVFIGGGVGAVLRYLLTVSTEGASLPVNLIPNLIGALLIGVMAACIQLISKEVWLLLVTGFLGGFTTFSGYIYFITYASTGKALQYVLFHHIIGVSLFFVGFVVAERVLKISLS